MYAKIQSAGLFGVDAYPVQAEADLSQGLPSFEIVGLPDTAVRESRDRVRSSLKNCGFDFPISRITVNLAPGSVKKEGPIYDLPILLAILKASGQLDADLQGSVFVGELSLSGTLRPVKGVLSMAIMAKEQGFSRLFIPRENAAEGSVVEGLEVFPAGNLAELVGHLRGEKSLTPAARLSFEEIPRGPVPDLSEVKGLRMAKRALEIAAAGGHNMLLIGPPGSGKSMLAKRLPSILPDMTFEESIETTKIHSIAGTLKSGVSLIRERPFRAPHHTISPSGLSGGGTIPRPGEISLSHHGVLFLDELPEFSRSAMEALRQPLEDGVITISRVAGTLSYPCSVMFVAAMNPCPCGFFGHPTRGCTCTDRAAASYLNRISGPLLDRLDLHVEVPCADYGELTGSQQEESSEQVRQRVNRARALQQQRFAGKGIACNARITPAALQEACPLTEEASALLKKAFERMGLSARGYDRILKIARTIADLEDEEKISAGHAGEAVQYRSLDRKYWQRNR